MRGQPEMTGAFRTGDVSSEAVGRRTRIVRLWRGETLAQFAPKIGMGAKNLQSVEKGQAYLRPAYADRIFSFYGVDFNFLYHGTFASLSVQTASELLRAAERLDAP